MGRWILLTATYPQAIPSSRRKSMHDAELAGCSFGQSLELLAAFLFYALATGPRSPPEWIPGHCAAAT